MRLAAKIIASMGSVTLGLILLSTPASAACLAEGAGCGNTSTPCCVGLVCALDSATIKHCVPGAPTTTTLPSTSTTTTTRPQGTTTTTTLPGPDPNAGVFQPTYRDVSIANHDPQLFFRGFQLDQAGRDKMVEQQWDYTPEAIIAARSIGCDQQAQFGVNQQTDVLCRFGCCGPYDNICEGHDWEITEQGADNLYDVPRSILKAIQSCATSGSKAAACANAPLFHPGLRSLLNLFVVGGRCVVGPEIVNPPFIKGGPGDDGKGIARDINVGKPDTFTILKLDALMEAHHQDVEWKCGRAPMPTLSVMAAMFDLQSTPYCQANADRRHFCQLKVFHGTPDPLYTAQENCENAELTHVFMSGWGEAFKTGQWGPTREQDTAHKTAHRFVVLKGNYKVILPCGQPCGKISVCPRLTREQAVAKFVP